VGVKENIFHRLWCPANTHTTRYTLSNTQRLHWATTARTEHFWITEQPSPQRRSRTQPMWVMAALFISPILEQCHKLKFRLDSRKLDA